MNQEEMRQKFEDNVKYLHRNVPPDDIYVFAEQTYMATLYFLNQWSKHVDINEEMANDSVTKKWVTNILGLLNLRDKKIDLQLDLDLKSIYGSMYEDNS